MFLKLLVAAPCLVIIFIQPINKQVESAWYFGFERVVTTPSVGVGKFKTPEVTVKAFYLPSGQQIVESVVNTAAEAAGLDVNFHVGNQAEMETAIIHGALNFGITDVAQISYILATARHETDNFKTLREYGVGGYCGQSSKYDGFSGVGIVMLTWKGNFEKQKNKLGFNDMTTEDFCNAIATRPDVAVTTLIGGMMDGDFTGKALPQYVSGDKRDYLNARRVVNGTDKAAHIASLAKGYENLVSDTLTDYGVNQK